MTKWTGRQAQRLTALVLTTYGTYCHLCGKPGADSADHLTPRSVGGSNSIDNLRPAHKICNSQRGARTIAQWRAKHQPYKAEETTADGWDFFK